MNELKEERQKKGYSFGMKRRGEMETRDEL